MSTNDALTRAAVAIVEESLYVFVDPGDTVPVADHRFSMHLDPPVQGCATIGIQADTAAATALAADMLGIEPGGLEPQDLSDAVAEVLNMVAGRFTVEAGMGDAAVDLHPPEAGGEAPANATCFDLAEGHVALWGAA